jgi:hypothetical protein
MSVVCAVLLLWSNVGLSGSITGVVKRLNNTAIANVTITVRDLENGNVVGPLGRSDSQGNYTVSLPDNEAVSVTFSNNGANEDALLLGISGSAVLTDFDVFMPEGKKKCCVKFPCKRRLYCRRR